MKKLLTRATVTEAMLRTRFENIATLLTVRAVMKATKGEKVPKVRAFRMRTGHILTVCTCIETKKRVVETGNACSDCRVCSNLPEADERSEDGRNCKSAGRQM